MSKNVFSKIAVRKRIQRNAQTIKTNNEVRQASKRLRTSHPSDRPPLPHLRADDTSASMAAPATRTRPRGGEGDNVSGVPPFKKRLTQNKPTFKRRLIFEPRPNLRAKISSFLDELAREAN